MPIIAGTPIVAPEVTFNIDTGTLHIGDHELTGIATTGMLNDTTWHITESLHEKISELEDEVRELRQLRNIFTADLARELVKRCERFVDNQELTGMTDEEFEAEIGSLLRSGGV